MREKEKFEVSNKDLATLAPIAVVSIRSARLDFRVISNTEIVA
jgi:hypothetical protein